jgi:hypothetical protein
MAVTFERVELIDSAGETKGTATLSVGEDRLEWGADLALGYTEIILHAMCTDLESFPKACIYMQLDRGEDVEELRLAPQNPSDLESIFRQLSRCAALHPDQGDEDDGEEGGDTAFYMEDMDDGSDHVKKMQRLDGLIVQEPAGPPPALGQFDEVEDDEEEDDL